MSAGENRAATAPKENIELKARLESLARAREVASSLADRRLPDQHQIDTYFLCQTGRLKLREICDERAELIAYQRPDEFAAKSSRYFVIPIAEAEQLKQALAMTLGVRGMVKKHREIYLHRNVRIHLDQVEGLGAFLEFEAVLDEGRDEGASRELVTELQGRFDIRNDMLLDTSYGEMVSSVDAASR